jgi:hypothetical protein
MATNRNTSSFSGKAAEHYVAAELARHGWKVVFLGGNFANSDLCIESSDGKRILWIQVKAFDDPHAQKVILKKTQVMRWTGDEKWYVFVGIAKETPDVAPAHYYCLPSKVVQDHAVVGTAKFIKYGGADTEFWGFNLRPYRNIRRGYEIAAFDAEELKKSDRNFQFLMRHEDVF